MRFWSGRSRGFTLIELLCAITILGLMMVIVVRSLSFVASARERAEDHRSLAQSLTASLRVVTGEMGRAFPLTVSAEGQTQLLFQGDEESVHFATVNPDYDPGEPFSVWHLRLVPDGEGAVLAVDRAKGGRTALKPSASGDKIGREVLRTQVPLAFSYRKPATEEEPAVWLPSWKGQSRLPEAVMLASTAGPDEAWPPWVVPLRIDRLYLCEPSYQGSAGEAFCPGDDQNSDGDDGNDLGDSAFGGNPVGGDDFGGGDFGGGDFGDDGAVEP